MSVTTDPTVPDYVAGTWTIDPVHSEIGFSVRHMMVSKVRGRFTAFSGDIVTGESPLDSSVTATIDLSSIDTGNPDRDNHIRSADFFEVDKHETMSFRSTGVRRDGEDYVVDGELTLKTITKPISLRLELGGFGPDPYGGTRTGFTAIGQLNRSDFGVDFNAVLEAGGVVVGDKVDILLEIEAVLNAWTAAAGFDARLVHTDREVAVVVQGEIDVATCGRLWPVMEQAISLSPRLVLDLADTTYIDSCGLALIVRAHGRLGQPRGAVVIRSPGPAARKLLGVTGVDRLVTIEGPRDGPGGGPGTNRARPTAPPRPDDPLPDPTRGTMARQRGNGSGETVVTFRMDKLDSLDRNVWPDMSLSRWHDTRDTLHLWTQIVGKVRLGLTPMINHWWQVPLYVSSRGLTTSLMHAGGRGVEIEFDFVDHVLELRTTDGERRRVARGGTVLLPPMSAGPASALGEAQARSPKIASSAVVVGTARLGEGSLLAEGAVIRSQDAGVEIGTGSAVLENSVVVGTTTIPTTIRRRTVFGHRSDGGGLEPVVPGRFDPRDLDRRTSSEVVADLVGDAPVVKAANTLGAGVLGADRREAGGQRVNFLSGDDINATAEVSALFEDAGFIAIDLGGLITGGEMQQIGAPLAGANPIRLPDPN